MDDECSICYYKLNEPNKDLESGCKDPDIYITPCNHAFHRICIETWLSHATHNDPKCPLCTQDLGITYISYAPDVETEDLLIHLPSKEYKSCIAVSSCCAFMGCIFLIFLISYYVFSK